MNQKYCLDYHQYKKSLFITAHPDDLEGFAGGLAYLLPAVYSVIFSEGDRGVWEKQYKQMDREAFGELRISEAQQAAQVLKIKEVTDLRYHDKQIKPYEESIGKALEQIQRHQPDAVFSFEFDEGLTVDPHPDHIAVGRIVRQAMITYRDQATVDYYVFSTFLPNRFVDISSVRPIKMRALHCHRSQRRLNRILFPFIDKIPSLVWGLLNHTRYAEGYRMINLNKLHLRPSQNRQL